MSGKEYVVYRMQQPALVLLSAADVPLAVVAIERMVIAPYDGNYQAISHQDAIPVKFVLTNCTSTDYVAIDILHRDPAEYAAVETDPGPAWAINEVNEIKPGETCIIEVDQRTGETMELRALPSRITVAQDRDRARSSGLGSVSQTLHVMVRAPADCPELQAMIAGAYWKSLDTIIRHEPAKRRLVDTFSDRRGDWFTDYAERSYSRPASYALADSAAMNVRSTRSGRKIKSVVGDAGVDDADVANSHVAAIFHTGHRLDVHSGETTVVYNGSNRCTTRLNLSVNTTMRMQHVDPTSVPDFVADWIKSIRESRQTELLKGISKVFVNEVCVLCLEPGPDLLVLGCAHQCLHAACVSNTPMTKCYMCRGNVSATLHV